MLAGLSIGSRIILYDGSPFHPDLRTYLKFINDQKYVPFFEVSIVHGHERIST